MKKILLFLILTFWVSNVMALEYTDYSEFGEFSEEVIKEDDLTDVKSERRYKYYKLNKALGPYMDRSSEEYPYLDKEDYIYTDYSEVSPIKPEDKEGRIIEEVKGYKYKKVKGVSFIRFTNSMGFVTIDNMRLFYHDKEVNYDIEFHSQSNGWDLVAGDIVFLKLPFEVDLRYFEMSFDIVSGEANNSFYEIETSDQYDFYYTFNQYEYKGNGKVNWRGEEAVSSKTFWEDYYSLGEMPTSNVLTLVDDDCLLYQYKDILYRSYALEKEYYPNYLTGPIDDYIYKDEDLYKDYYAKRVRSIISENTIDEVTEDKVNHQAADQDLSIPLKNDNNLLILEDASSEIIKSEKVPYYKLEVPKMESKIEVSKWELLYVLFPFVLILVILILVLSKLYKNRKACDTL